ncbi:hypothetical protein [Paracoccus benzoatiresistens]|uniref:Uncharacterized protein n=1 Tax=Paracoccus benzoatiresistens TaxID=2997341 RepID=A0ABT4J577_9RHOB|nr:hypothetical protein [Paracoccus sp. EF6]MCZ0961586.1 hypothetical protein [Paracoccus sp. EF6]
MSETTDLFVTGGGIDATMPGGARSAALTESERRWMIKRECTRDAEGVMRQRPRLGLLMSPRPFAAVEDCVAGERVAA